MTLSHLVTQSIRVSNYSWRVISVLYISMLLLSASMAFGFRSALSSAFGDSMLPERLLEGFDSNLFNDFMRANEGFFAPIVAQMTWLVVFWLALNTLFGGGIIAALRRTSVTSFGEFFADCGRYFIRFFLLALLSAAVFFVFGTVWVMIVGVLYSAMTAGSLTEVPNVIGALIAASVFLLPMIIIMMIFDYTRVRIVLEDASSVFSAAWRSTKFVIRNFFATLGWQLLMLLLLLILAGLYWVISSGFSMETGFGIFLIFLLQQISVVSRIWARLVTIGGQVQLHESRDIAEVSVGTVGFVPPIASPLPPMPSINQKTPKSKRKSAAKRTVKKKPGRGR